jgi:manganese transport protein
VAKVSANGKSEKLDGSGASGDAGDAWRVPGGQSSLHEVHRSVAIPSGLGFWRKLLAFSGPGFLVAVGYMDPGNWATDLAGGSRFGYTLLSVVFISNLMAILLQALAAKLGIVSGRDLAQACRDHYSKPVSLTLWALCEVAICACDLAEVIGSAIALYLLFAIPLLWGVSLTALDVLAVLYLQNKGFRYIEALVISLILLIGGCFLAEIIFCKPGLAAVLAGFVPRLEILKNKDMLYIAIGILGATVMPHNLYLHSSIVQTRKYEQNIPGKADAIKFATLDSTIALMFALFINAAILVVAGAVFFPVHKAVDDIRVAYQLFPGYLGLKVSSVIFAVALLASGQNATLTGTLAGQIVMEGFLNIRLRPWLRRLLTRALAIIPAVVVVALHGHGTIDQQFAAIGKLLIFSQVVLSLQLSFAVVPLVLFTSDRKKMGQFVNRPWLVVLAWLTTAVIIVLNLKYVLDFIGLTG